MDKKIISFDLGTGGNKASLYDVEGNCLASTLFPTLHSILRSGGMNSALKIGGMQLWKAPANCSNPVE